MNIRRKIHIVAAAVIGILLTGALYTLFSQQNQSVQQATNVQGLQRLAQEYSVRYQQQFQVARTMAEQAGLPVRKVLPNGRVIQVHHIDPLGNLRYYTTLNLDAAGTISTDDVWPESEPGGTAVYNLTGNGMTVGEWDAGEVLESHQEFGIRADYFDEDGLSRHATHVAGILVAEGLIDDAHGMAYEANLDAYNWDNDNSEMAIAAGNGLLVSNHSYGFIVGWEYNFYDDGHWVWFGDTNVSETEDYYFGYYSSEAAAWDQIARDARYYLPVVAAGNDGADSLPDSDNQFWLWNGGNGNNELVNRNSASFIPEPDGPFENISGSALAKNVMTVGAVQSIPGGFTSPVGVDITYFSSRGPTDDGRIKPDLVADGDQLYSTDTLATEYTYSSGTSMATPTVTGSLLLLQELYMREHGGAQMRAATLKALAIQTADDAGNPGPDYTYGWGLMNTKSAADLIMDDGVNSTIVESDIQTDGQRTFTVQLSDESKPLIATLAWTDPAGDPPLSRLNSPAQILVNDLDMMILDSDGGIFQPWILNPGLPDDPASTGINDVDNVEQVYITAADTGTYEIVISPNGPLEGGSQEFSLIVNTSNVPNIAPKVVSALEDTTLLEDFGSVFIANLDTVFSDQDDTDLAYFAETDGITDAVINDSLLVLNSVEDETGISQIIVSAYDQQSTVSDTILVDVVPVNDPPDPFALNEPLDHHLNNSNRQMHFEWETAEDAENDAVTYLFTISDSVSFSLEELVTQPSIDISIGLAELPRDRTLHWSVAAFDDQDTSFASNGPFTVLVSSTIELVEYGGAHPTELVLFQNFPNPVRIRGAGTLIGYGLPQSAQVRIDIYDISGRHVRTLVNGLQSSGWHAAQWNGRDDSGTIVGAGVYFYRMVAEDFQDQNRLVLLR